MSDFYEKAMNMQDKKYDELLNKYNDLLLENADLKGSRKAHMEATQELQAENYKLMKSRDYSREASEELLAENKKLRADIANRVECDFWGQQAYESEKDHWNHENEQLRKDTVLIINQHAATLQELDKLRKMIKHALYSDELSNGHGDSIGALNEYFEELEKKENE